MNGFAREVTSDLGIFQEYHYKLVCSFVRASAQIADQNKKRKLNSILFVLALWRISLTYLLFHSNNGLLPQQTFCGKDISTAFLI
jgi:hypothetical protein